MPDGEDPRRRSRQGVCATNTQPGRSLFRGRLVRLAAPLPEDAPALARWSEDAEYQRLLDIRAVRPISPDVAAERDKARRADPALVEFRLRTLSDDRLIGFVALYAIDWNHQTARLAIGIGEPSYRGKGYGADALQLILRYAFDELNLHRVGAEVASYNGRALHVLERGGFRREGVLREAVQRDGQRWDLVLLGILRREWAQASPAG